MALSRIKSWNTNEVLGATDLNAEFNNILNYLNNSGLALTSPTITGGTHTAITTFGLRSTGAAFDLQFATSEVLTASRAISWNVGDAARSITLGGNISTAGAFSTSGANAVILTTTGSTNVTLPTTGTLATLAGTEEFDNKTLDSSVGKGTWTASGTWTLPALTLGGAITYGGVALSNAVTGTGNMVLSASPTISGTLAASTLTATTFNGLTITSSAAGVLTITAGKTLTTLKTLSFTAADDSGVYTLPTGTKTLVATDVDTLSSLTNVSTITTGVWNAGAVTSTAVISTGAVTGNQLKTTGAISAAAWTTTGLRVALAAATLTDSSSSGTIAAVYGDAFKALTIAASSATVYTNAYGAFFEAPIAGTNVTLTDKYALGAASLGIMVASSGRSWARSIATAAVFERNGGVGITLSGASASELDINFATEGDEDRGKIRYDNGSDFMAFHIAAAEFARISGVTLVPISDNTKDLGTAGVGWRNIYSDNVLNIVSDARRKTDVEVIDYATPFVMALKPRAFRMIEGDKTEVLDPKTGKPLLDAEGNQIFTSRPGVRRHHGFRSQDVRDAVLSVGTKQNGLLDKAGNVNWAGWGLADKNDPDSAQHLRLGMLLPSIVGAFQELRNDFDSYKAAHP